MTATKSEIVEVQDGVMREGNPKLSSLRNYAELAQEFDLLRSIVVSAGESGEGEETTVVTVHLSFMEMPYEFEGGSAFADACSFLHIIAQTAQSQHDD